MTKAPQKNRLVWIVGNDCKVAEMFEVKKLVDVKVESRNCES